MSETWPARGPFLRDRPLIVEASGRPSAMDKQATDTPTWLDRDGFKGDRVVNVQHHGGPDRTVCHYPAQHYALWIRHYPFLEGELAPGAFGENLSTEGLSEREVCIGDCFRWGEAVIQVSQPRSPCSTLEARHEAPRLSRRMSHSGAIGWLYRTLESGWVAPNAPLERIEPHPARVSVARVWAVHMDTEADNAGLQALAELAPLAKVYRDRFRQRLDYRRRQADQGRLFP